MSIQESQSIEIKVPVVGESINEVFIGEWFVEEGQYVKSDTSLVGLETDKATFEVPAPAGGTVTKILKQVGETANIGEVIATFTPSEAKSDSASKDAKQSAAAAQEATREPEDDSANASDVVMPAAERMMKQHNLSDDDVKGSGPGGRVMKEDVQRKLQPSSGQKMSGSRETKVVPLSPIRQTIANRLVEAQQTAALLTTFNEIDMTAVKELRNTYRDAFQKKHGRKLGFMPFFVRAVVGALEELPQVNAQMRDKKLVYHNYCDIGIAVGGGKGLVVPVLRNAEQMNFAEIENSIADFAARAQKNQISLEELEGGTFTITNGGVYGSLLSTPIVNPPQSGVLGMHGIVDRPIALNGEVVIRPMMYVALTYDHRIVDGREAVTFLRRVKEQVEDPARMVIDA